MKVDVTTANPALISMINNPNQIITLDANFLIPPCRQQLTTVRIEFKHFKKIWLDPIFKAFPQIAIHEAVYEELVDESPRNFIKSKLEDFPQGIIIHKDSSLSEIERILRSTIESKIASRTKYDPLLNNRDDRGEVKSLSFIAVRGLLYFAAHDNNAIQLIEKSAAWSTGLDNVQAIKMFELLFYLHKNTLADNKALKMLYKYQYYLTENEKRMNPDWGVFTSSMEILYDPYFS